MRKKMFDMVVQAHLGSLTLEMPQIESADSAETLYLIDNEIQKGDHLINVTYKQVFKTFYVNTMLFRQRKKVPLSKPSLLQTNSLCTFSSKL